MNETVEEHFDKKSINQLLKLGTKVKLLDVDLTKYFRLTCAHLEPINEKHSCDQSTNCREQHDHRTQVRSLTYLERKFDEIFLRRFYALPGFNDLFVLTSQANSGCTAASTSQKDTIDVVTGLVAEVLTGESNHIDLDEEDQNLDEANSDELDSDNSENYPTESDSSSNMDEGVNSGALDSESEINSVATTGYYDESDSNEPQVNLYFQSLAHFFLL